MTRKLYKPYLKPETHALPIHKGGTGAINVAQAIANLGLISENMKDVPNGAVSLDENKHVSLAVIPDALSNVYDHISGPNSIQIDQAAEFIITDYDSFKNYDLSANSGSVSRSGSTITYTAPNIEGSAGFTINGKTIAISITLPSVDRPEIVNPLDGTSGVGENVDFAGSGFTVPGNADTHEFSDWQLATDIDFNTIVQQVASSTTNKTIWTVVGLTANTTYYVRVRYKGVIYGYSDWSMPSAFTTKASFGVPTVDQPSITSPANGAVDQLASVGIIATAFSVTDGTDSHEGTDWQLATDAGFTSIVSQLTNSATNKTSWTVTGLSANTTYYVRVRYKGTAIGYGAWSSTISFTTKVSFVTATINQPSITSPANGAINQLASVTISANAFSVNAGSDTHAASDWQLSTSSTFATIAQQLSASTTSKTSWTVNNLAANTTYYVRVRYKGTNLGYSAWSTASSFKTKTSFVTPAVNTPSITSPTNGAQNLLASVNLTGSAFGVNTGSDTHAASDWQLSKSSTFATIVASVTASTTSKTTWSVSNLDPNTTYYVRVRYKGTSYGYSAWSPTSNFKTKETFYPSIEEAMVSASNKSANAYFGNSGYRDKAIALSSDGSRMVVGVPNATITTGGVTYPYGGAAYVYVRSGNSWSQEAIIMSGIPGNNANWASSVSINSDGTRILIGGTYADRHLEDPDIPGVYVTDYYPYIYTYTRSGSTWSLETRVAISYSSMQNTPAVKTAMSLDGIRAVVITSSTSRVFVRSGSSWTTNEIIPLPAGVLPVNISSVDISGDGSRLIIGYNLADPGGSTDAGAAYVYRRSSSTWTLEATLTASDKAANDYFGERVAISKDGTRVVIGARYADPGGTSGAGAAYVYRRSNTTWTQEQKLIASDKGASDLFGNDVTIDQFGEKIIIGSPYNNSSSTADNGAAYVYTRSGTTWSQKIKLVSSDHAVSNNFGYSVAINSNGDRAGIGCPGRDSGGVSNSGGAYVFR